LFAFLTLPVEVNASSKAQELLVSQGIISGDEQITGVEKVFGAAAWTYVAAAVTALGRWRFYVVLLKRVPPAIAADCCPFATLRVGEPSLAKGRGRNG
jgi:Zn-dependent membrane protease YugP